jgi:hypothetical protein
LSGLGGWLVDAIIVKLQIRAPSAHRAAFEHHAVSIKYRRREMKLLQDFAIKFRLFPLFPGSE